MVTARRGKPSLRLVLVALLLAAVGGTATGLAVGTVELVRSSRSPAPVQNPR